MTELKYKALQSEKCFFFQHDGLLYMECWRVSNDHTNAALVLALFLWLVFLFDMSLSCTVT